MTKRPSLGPARRRFPFGHRPVERRSERLDLLDMGAFRPLEVELSPGSDACTDCSGRLRRIGEDVTEELEYVPGRFVVSRIVRPRLTCACCERFVQAHAIVMPNVGEAQLATFQSAYFDWWQTRAAASVPA